MNTTCAATTVGTRRISHDVSNFDPTIRVAELTPKPSVAIDVIPLIKRVPDAKRILRQRQNRSGE